MLISVLVAQFPISISVKENLARIEEVIDQSKPGDLVVLPEGSVSGYSCDLSFLRKIDQPALQRALCHLQAAARIRSIHLWAGSCVYENGNWFNAGLGFTPQGKIWRYYKINLAQHERGVFTAGWQLPIFRLNVSNVVVKIGVQICREVRFPEQWGLLARSGAQVVLHLNNAIGNAQEFLVWQSHLISRAAETQRFVVSANNAAPDQKSPTIVVAPDGKVLGVLDGGQKGILRIDMDLTLVSDWYLSQCRKDIVVVGPPSSVV